MRSAVLAALADERGEPPIDHVVVLSPSADDAPTRTARPYHVTTRVGDLNDPAAIAGASWPTARA